MHLQGKGKLTLPGEAYLNRNKKNMLQQGTVTWVMGLYSIHQTPTHLPPCCSDFTCISSLVHIPRTTGCHCIKSLLWQQDQPMHPYPPPISSHLWAQALAWNPRAPDWQTAPFENSLPACQSPQPSMQLKTYKHWVVAQGMEMLWPPRRGSPGPSCHQPYPHRLPLGLYQRWSHSRHWPPPKWKAINNVLYF